MISIFLDSKTFVALWIISGVVLGLGIWGLHRAKARKLRRSDGNRTEDSGSRQVGLPPAEGSKREAGEGSVKKPLFATYPRSSELGMDLGRALIILLSFTVAMALILALIPQSLFDNLVQYIETRNRQSTPEKIALLYLGDRFEGNQLRIRGVVRNIAPTPIERLDVILRFYAHDRTLLETTVLRLNKEVIAPNEIAQFELLTPTDQPSLSGYSIEFKLRQGEVMPYRDLRRMPTSEK